MHQSTIEGKKKIFPPISDTPPDSMKLGALRGTSVYDELARKLRAFSLLISPTPHLGVGGSGTLVKCKDKVGILTATHVLIYHLDAQCIFAPCRATEDPTFFLNDRIPIKRIIYLETDQGLQELAKTTPYPEDTLDICLIELDTDVFEDILQKSGKKFVDMSVYRDKYNTDFESYCCSCNDWCWAMDGATRENVMQDDNDILHSRYDGLYVSGGNYRSTPLVHVPLSFNGIADLCVHQLGPTLDSLPNNYEGLSGAGVWQVAFTGDNGIPTGIHELFFSGVLVCGRDQEMIASRGPTSLYDIFLCYLDSKT